MHSMHIQLCIFEQRIGLQITGNFALRKQRIKQIFVTRIGVFFFRNFNLHIVGARVSKDSSGCEFGSNILIAKMTNITTHLRKMSTELIEGSIASYKLPLVNVLDYTESIPLNEWVGKEICIEFTSNIHCIATGKKIKKTYGEGLSYDAFLSSPLSSPSIVNPELSRIHEGIALRDFEWEQKHHNQPHFVYLSRTSDIKVGVTRSTNLYSRWIDQGATEGIRLAETPYRQLAGSIEVMLKEFLADKTAWQAMLKGECSDMSSLLEKKNRLLDELPEEVHPFIADNDQVIAITYPILQHPTKPKSIKLDTTPKVEGVLMGIKGQYLLLDNDRVFNVRSHAAYEVHVSIN